MTGALRRNDLTRGKFHPAASVEEARAACESAVATKAKSKAWTQIEVPSVPTAIGETQRWVRDEGPYQAWEIKVIDKRTIETTMFRQGKPAGSTLWQCEDLLDRSSQAELLIAEQISSGLVREGHEDKPLFMWTGYPL